MVDGYNGLMQSANDQWRTIQKLLEIAPVDVNTRRVISIKAGECQSVIQEQRKRTPIGRDFVTEHVEEISSTLEEIIEESDEGSLRMLKAVGA